MRLTIVTLPPSGMPATVPYFFVIDRITSVLTHAEREQLQDFYQAAGARGILISEHEEIDVDAFATAAMSNPSHEGESRNG